MKLSEFKKHLAAAPAVNFVQPNGHFVPRHFHITEAGLTTKHFIDCGGTIRTEKAINFQVWVANDFEHRLSPTKLLDIIDKAAPLLGNDDLEVEVEYQNETIGRYGVSFDGSQFQLTAKSTDCLAKETCGVASEISELTVTEKATAGCCTPGGGCC